jgi:hypothetical protein
VITGGCLCGAVRYAIDTDAPLAARACWCRLCQYLGAGSATVNVVFPADKVSMSGTLSHFDGIADSGNHMRRGFCPVCGTGVTSEAEERPGFIVLRAGTLDDPAIAAPSATIWVGAAPDWAAIADDIPRHPGQLPPAA